jgi:Sulfotransferase family
LNKACQRLQNEIPAELALVPSYSGMLVDDVRRYIYCVIGKVSNTSWKRTLLKLSGHSTVGATLQRTEELSFSMVHRHAAMGKVLKKMDNFTLDQIQFRLKNYFKFMFVREPLERLLSAYRDKMVRDKYYVKRFKPLIVEKYRNGSQSNASEYNIISNSGVFRARQNVYLLPFLSDDYPSDFKTEKFF